MDHKSRSNRLRKNVTSDEIFQKDYQISQLQEQLRAANERILHLELRNRATLDTLDDLHSVSVQDAAQAQKDLDVLRRRSAVLEEEAEKAIAEKDDMSNSITLLIQKVEECNNDFSTWQPARLQMSRSLSFAPQANIGPNLPMKCNCPNAYAPAVVEELSKLLERERRAHNQTLCDTEERILHYEAAIARREADLACVISNCRCSPSVLGTHVLTAEVEHLRSELDGERRRVEVRQRPREEVSTISPNVFSQTSPPRQSPSPVVSQNEHQKANLDEYNPDGIGIAHPTGLQFLSEGIEDLRSEIRRLTTEKDALHQTIETAFPHSAPLSGPPGQVALRQVLRLEEECLRLVRTESALRDELTNAGDTARRRETELLREIEILRVGFKGTSHHNDTSGGLVGEESLIADDPFRSPAPSCSALIDSSFPPLTPDLSASVPITHPDPDPSALPLPLSPIFSPLTSPHTTTATSPVPSGTGSTTLSQSSAPRRLFDIEADLALERGEAERREREIEEIRELIGTLCHIREDVPNTDATS